MHCVSRGGSYLVNSHSDVQEEDRLRRESYKANWLDLVMETRPQHQLTLSEKDDSRRESYELQQVIHFLVQRYHSQRPRLEIQGGGVMKDQHHHHQLPVETTLLMPVFNPQRAETPWIILPAISPCWSMEGLYQVTNGVCVDKQEVSSITKDLPKLTKPIRVNFRATGLMSSPREASGRVPNRE